MTVVTQNGRAAPTKRRRHFGFVTKQGSFVESDVLGRYTTKSESKQISDRFENQYGDMGLVEPLYNPESLAQLLEMNTYHYRASKTKARDTAGLGWSIESTEETQPGATKAIWRAVKAFIARTRRHTGKQTAAHDQLVAFFRGLSPPLPILLDRAQLDYESVGWGALELVRQDYAADGPLSTIAHVPAHTLRVHKDGNRYAQIRGARKRWFKAAGEDIDVDQDNGRVHPKGSLDAEQRATEIIWWQNYTPRSDFYGLPDIMPALGALHGDLARRDFNIAFFDNFGVPAYAVFITGDFDEGEIDPDTGKSQLEEAIEEHFRELAKHPHSVLVMTIPTLSDGQNVKVEFVPLAVQIKEVSFRLYRQDNRDEILAAHGVPPYRAGIAETGSLGGSTAQESTEIYKTSVIEPRQTVLEDLINRYIIQGAFDITDWLFRLANIDNDDEMHEADLLGKLDDHGAVWPDEIREHFTDRFGLDPERGAPGRAMVVETESTPADRQVGNSGPASGSPGDDEEQEAA